MRYDGIELPTETWIVRMALGHRLGADGVPLVNDLVSARRPAGVSMPIWRQAPDEEPETVRFPDPVVCDYAMNRIVPLVGDFHALASRLSGFLLDHEAAPLAIPDGINVGLTADIEIWGDRERPTEIDLWVEAPRPDRGPDVVRLLARWKADAPAFARRAFAELVVPTELDAEGRVVSTAGDDDSDWADLRAAAESFRRQVTRFLDLLPEAD